MVYVSRYSNPELKTGCYTLVRISLGAPRWKTGYTLAGAIKELMPAGLRQIDSLEEFCKLYYERLDSFGINKIKEQIRYYESFGKPVVLLCFEDIRKGGCNWCHRTVFAKWWQKRTGETISELKDSSAFKIEGDRVVIPEVPSPEEHDNERNSISEIRFVLTDDAENKVYANCNGEEIEITFEQARKLLRDDRARIADIELKN